MKRAESSYDAAVSEAVCNKLFPPLHQDHHPYHALVCRLQLLELPLKHQAAVQNLIVVLMALTDVPTATAQLEGEGIFLLKDLR